MKSPRCRREKTRIEVSEDTLRLVEVPDQQESPDFKIPRKAGIQSVAVRFERRPSRVEHFRRPAQVTRGEGDVGLGYHASRTGHGFFRTEGTGGFPQEFLRSYKITELRHRDAAKGECWRIVA